MSATPPRPPYLAPDWTPPPDRVLAAADEIAELRRTIAELGRAVAELATENARLQAMLAVDAAAKSVPAPEIPSPPA